MRQPLKILLLVLAAWVQCVGQQPEANVISYYAVGNSLDGQPMVDMPNVLRFFPVFAMRREIESVTATIYYGSRIYTRRADSLDGKRHWEALLPQFKLGEAIQRVEVKVEFRLKESFRSRLQLANVLQTETQKEIDRLDEDLKMSEEDFGKKKPTFAYQIKEIDAQLDSLGISKGVDADRLRRAYEKGDAQFSHILDSLVQALNIPMLSTDDALRIKSLAKTRSEELRSFRSNFASYQSFRRELLREKLVKTQQLASTRDSILDELAKEIEIGLLDTSYSGPSLRKSDLVINPDFMTASLLYRNYKTSLRFMPALDPAERMGIFRARYIPFPIVGTDANPRMGLKKPFTVGSPTVFEIGLAFGDAIVPGDEFVVPEFSWRRLGIAFAITERLFSDSAQVIALALTYDFNSYGSIGIGGNFAGRTPHGYASLGINKKAFEAVIGGLVKLFK